VNPTPPPWFADYAGKLIGFVVRTRRDKYLPLIGMCYALPDEDDCIINVTYKNQQYDTIEDAVRLLDEVSPGTLHRIFRKPVPSAELQWLGPLVKGESEPRQADGPIRRDSPDL
jgi:hypothetical protein